MGWRRNRKKQRDKNRDARKRDRARQLAGPLAAQHARPGPLMAERQARIAAAQAKSAPQDAQGGPGTPEPSPGQQRVPPQAATGPEGQIPQAGVQGANGQRDTALFESRGATRSDAVLVRKAVVKRWDTDHRMAEAILTKIGLKALEDKLTEPQLLGAGKLMLDIERQNQAQEHHVERMDFYERQLELRRLQADLPPVGGPLVQINQGNGDGQAVGVAIYLPTNGRDNLDVPFSDPPPDDEALS